jgi:hypothetical protein
MPADLHRYTIRIIISPSRPVAAGFGALAAFFTPCRPKLADDTLCRPFFAGREFTNDKHRRVT